MAQPLVGALRVTLGLNSAEFSKGLKRADKAMADFSRKMAAVGKAMAVAVGAGAAGLSAAVVKTSKLADEMGKTAQAVGLSVERLSELRHAADMSGASFEQLQTGLRRLSQNMNDAAAGVGEGREAFERLGISVTRSDGTLKSSKEVLDDMADAFSDMPDGAEKTALALDLMGRSGATLIPLLNQGAFGLEQMAKEARNLGLVISADTFRAAEAFNDNLSRLRKVFQGVTIQVTAGVLPAFRNLTDRMVEGLTNSDALKRATSALSAGMNVLARAITLVFENLHHLVDLLKVFIAFKIVSFVAGAAGAFVTLARAIRTAGLASIALATVTRAKITTIALLAAVAAKAAGKFDDLTKWVRETGAAIERSLPPSMREGVQGLQDEFDKLFGDINAVGAQLESDTGKYWAWSDEAQASIQGVGSTAQRVGRSMKGALSDPWEGYRKTAGRAIEDTASRFQSAGQSMGSSLRGLIDRTRSWLDVLQDALGAFVQFQLNSMAKPSSAAGGLFQGLLRGFASFDGGGFTGKGPRVGGLDGKGGMPAIVHPNETIIDHTRMQAMAPGGGGPIAIAIDFTGEGIRAIARDEAGEVVGEGIRAYDSETAPQTVRRTIAEGRDWGVR